MSAFRINTNSKGSGAMVLGLLLFPIFAASSLEGQISDPSGGAGKATQSVEASKAKQVEILPVDVTPSRLAWPNVDQYVASRLAVLSVQSKQEIDPFGLHQDVNRKPVPRQVIPENGSRGIAMPNAIKLTEIISKIPVTTIMPSEKKFLVKSRVFREGDVIPLVYQGKKTEVVVEKVTAREIHFKNQKNNETAIYSLKMLPPGMLAGSGNQKPPGVVDSGMNAPLTLTN